MATDLQETELMARIEGGDLVVALEAKYHLECLTALHNYYRSFKLQLGKVSVQMPSASSSATGNKLKDCKLFTLCRNKLLGFDLRISCVYTLRTWVDSVLLTNITYKPIHCGLYTIQ